LAGRGNHVGTKAGQAVSDVARAKAGLAGVRQEPEHGLHSWARRTAAKEAFAGAERQADARQRWQDHVAPELSRLDAVVGLRADELRRLNASVKGQTTRSATVVHQRRVAQGIIVGLGAGVGQYRDRLDSSGQQPVERAGLPVYPPFGAHSFYHAPAPGCDPAPDL
jgi:hypothetical protein